MATQTLLSWGLQSRENSKCLHNPFSLGDKVERTHMNTISLWDIHNMPTRSKFTFFPVFLNF